MRRRAGLLAVVLAAATPIAARAQSLCPPTDNPCIVQANVAFNGLLGATIDLGTRDLVVAGGVSVTAVPGPLSISAGSITVKPGGRIVAPGALGAAAGGILRLTSIGNIVVQTDPFMGAGVLDVSAQQEGGEIDLTAGGDIVVDGLLDAHANRFGFGGTFNILSTAGNVSLGGAGPIDGSGGGQGAGGQVSITTRMGSIQVDGPLDFSGGDAGTIEMAAHGDLVTSVTGKLLVFASAPLGSGGFVTLASNAMVSVGGLIDGHGEGDSDGGGDGGDIVITADTITVAGMLDLSGAAPDGQGGSLSSTGGDITLTGLVMVPGKGPDGCGGELDALASRSLVLGPTDLSAGSCGAGTMNVRSDGTASVAGEINVDGNRRGTGGEMTARAQSLTISNKVHASGLAGGGPGGVITLQACTLRIDPTGQVSTMGGRGGTTGKGGRNTLRANGDMTIAGPVVAGGKSCVGGADDGKACNSNSGCTQPSTCLDTGVNTIEYADPTHPPVITGFVSPITTPVVNTNIIPCTGPEPTTTTTTSVTTTSVTTTTSSSNTTLTLPVTTTSSSTTTTTPTIGSTSSTSSSTSSTSTSRSTTSSSSTSITTTTSSSRTTTSTSRTTSSSRTTSTSTSSSSSTSSSTTSTSLPPPECVGSDATPCNDDDACTTDQCVGGSCVHQPVVDVLSVTCRLENLQTMLGHAAPEDVGGVVLQGRFANSVGKIFNLVQSAPPGTRRGVRLYKRAGGKLKAFVTSVQKGKRRGKIRAELADRMTSLAQGAMSQLLPLEKPPGR